MGRLAVNIEDKVFNAIILKSTIPITKDDLYILSSCFMLGFHRYFVANLNGINRYFEVTYDHRHNEWIVYEYTLIERSTIDDKTLTKYTKCNS